tara:strand:- start:10785 stop:11663 length:879 start_codon:yes stop_codon:yes gene_type:complete
MKRKGIILAGGSGSRLYPSTSVNSKQLLPVYDKPLIYYPISTLMYGGIRDILLISTPAHLHLFKELLGSGKDFGLKIEYKVQKKPQGIAQSLLLAKNFLKDSPCALILGDNIFYGPGLREKLHEASLKRDGATIFGYTVKDPERYGVVKIDKSGKPIKISEKPKKPKSNLAVTGLYFYDNKAVSLVKDLKPSKRGELEITDLNRLYMDQGNLKLQTFSRGFAWLDTGTPESLHDASTFIRLIEERQNFKISCLEEIAFKNKWISRKSIEKKFKDRSDGYSKYLMRVINNENN